MLTSHRMCAIPDEYLQDCIDALFSAFPKDFNLSQLLLFRMALRWDKFVVGSVPYYQQIRQTVEWMQTEGKTCEFLLKAEKENRGNPELKAFMKKLRDAGVDLGEADAAPAPGPQDLTPGLQAFIARAGVNISGAQAQTMIGNIHTACLRVCRVMVNGAFQGTGFLVGERHVMTNYHVVTGHPPQNLKVIFDKVDGGKPETEAKVMEVPHKSPVRECDFAILKLGPAFSNDGRGWYVPVSHTPARQELIYIAQHGGGLPVSIAGGIVSDFFPMKHMVAYTANTQPGSSGSPVFDGDWNVITIHHQGDKMNNHGVPISSVLKVFGADFFEKLT